MTSDASVRFSLNRGAEIEHPDDPSTWTEYSALGLAVAHGHSVVVRYLLGAGASTSVELVVYDEDDDEVYIRSLLQEAVVSRHRFKKRLELIEEHIVVYHTGDLADTATAEFRKRLNAWLIIEPRPLQLLQNPEFLAAVRDDSDHVTIINILLDHNADISVRGRTSETLLHTTVMSTPRLNALLQHIKDQGSAVPSIDDRDQFGRTPLHHACISQNADVMKLLIQHGADVMATDDCGVSTLHFAVNSPACIAVALVTWLQVDGDNDHSADLLEQAMKRMSENEGSQLDLAHVIDDFWNTECEECQKLGWWINSKSDESTILCESNIEQYLGMSQQHSYVEELAKDDAEAKTRPRTWILAN